MNMAMGAGRCSGKVTETTGCSRARLKRRPFTLLHTLEWDPILVDHHYGELLDGRDPRA